MAHGVVLFAGGGRKGRPDRQIAARLHDAQFGTLLFDLLTPSEQRQDEGDNRYHFDIAFLAHRLLTATDWLVTLPGADELAFAYLGFDTGAAAAIRAAVFRAEIVHAVVSSDGRPDLAGGALTHLESPILLIVAGPDARAARAAAQAEAVIQAPKRVESISAPTDHEDEAGIDLVASLALNWFREHMAGAPHLR
jgi:putative phosphoribosyl transferase